MRIVATFLVAVLVTACGSASDGATETETTSDVQERIDEISAYVSTWHSAGDLATATVAAEAAANLVVGPDGPGYGDRNGDGKVSGATETGLLPGLDGTPIGLVRSALGDAECVLRDVLGGSWDDPGNRWMEMTSAIAEWTPSNNTFPSLASHPMRIVGWATLSQTTDLDSAHEYAGHAALHVSVSSQALAGC